MEIEGYDNYLIFEDGRVFSKKSNIFLKAFTDTEGYKRLNLNKDGKRKIFRIHRLMALHYIPNPNNYPCVDHKDRNRQNNSIDNLRWVTPSMNQQNTGVRKNNKLSIKNISPHGNGNGYMFVKNMKGKIHRKYFKTLEDAIKYKEEYLNQLERPATVVVAAAATPCRC
jgi:hypothetical protein